MQSRFYQLVVEDGRKHAVRKVLELAIERNLGEALPAPVQEQLAALNADQLLDLLPMLCNTVSRDLTLQLLAAYPRRSTPTA